MNCNKCGKDMVLGEFVIKAGLCTECYLENGRTKGDVTRDERALTIPDIYLAEFVGVLHRACDNDRPTEALWGMLDHWCNEQERYLEEKYPTKWKGEEFFKSPANQEFRLGSLESVTVDWRDSLTPEQRTFLEQREIGPHIFGGLSEFIRTGYHDPEAPEHTTASIVEDILNAVSAGIDKQTRNPFALGAVGRLGSIPMHAQDLARIRETQRRQAGEPKEPDIATYIWDEAKPITQEDYERIADRLMKENNRRQTSVSINVDTQAFREGLERFAEQAAEAARAVAPEMEGEEWGKMTPFRRRFPVAFPSLRRDKSGITTILSIQGMDDTGAIAIEPEEPRLESLEWSDNRAPVAPCSCRQFQGDSLECPQHGRGSAWHDLHGGE